MALNRVNGKEDIFVGGVFALRRPAALQEHKITHILSMIDYSLEQFEDLKGRYQHMSIDIDDVDDEDLIVHLPRCVRFIEQALYPEDPAAENPHGAVYVHCAMGKSRSVSAVVAYLLWKHPHRFGATDLKNPDRAAASRDAVARAVKWVRETRSIAEPNPGFMKQLEMWWEMGCPADADDAVEKLPVYQRWLYKREVEESVRIGKAPDWILFEDEEESDDKGSQSEAGLEIRCKKCRRVLATKPFVVSHDPMASSHGPCPHYFVEPLSWMRSILEGGALEGRLTCPNPKCGSSVGRYAWQGFKCSCQEWVCPAFSLQRSKVDEITTRPKADAAGGALHNIRRPPVRGTAKENL